MFIQPTYQPRRSQAQALRSNPDLAYHYVSRISIMSSSSIHTLIIPVIVIVPSAQNMGLDHGAKVLNSAKGLYIQDAAILRGLARECGMKITKIDVDCANV